VRRALRRGVVNSVVAWSVVSAWVVMFYPHGTVQTGITP
jgi:hypothetical protein